MHFGINKEVKGHQVTVQAACGLEPTPGEPALTLTVEELTALGIAPKRAERVSRKLAEWVNRNPEQNRKELLEQLALGIDAVL